jgi:hypothetical protein
MKSIVGSLSLAAGAAASISVNDLKFLNFIAQHGKNYDTIEEYNIRSNIWAEKEMMIN